VTPEVIALCMFGLLLLGLFMGHPLAFVLGGTAVLGALIAGKPMVLGIVINRIFGDVPLVHAPENALQPSANLQARSQGFTD
jgi:TRAP-type mannitol/chloroaromatic compound transport system permease large subunit